MLSFSKKLFFLLILFFVFASQTNATTLVYYQYFKHEGKVYYGSSLKNGTLVKGVHYPSFKGLNGAFGVDKRSLYLDGKRLQKAPKDTVTFLHDGYFIVDNKTVYYGNKKIKEADAKTFRVHQFASNINDIAVDKKHVYCDGEIIPIDAPSFEPINSIYFKDKNGIYSVYFARFSNSLEDADPDNYYLYDKSVEHLASNNHVYRNGWKTVYDPQEFEILKLYNIRNNGSQYLLRYKDSIYIEHQALDIDAKSFVFFGDYLMKDKNGVYNHIDYYWNKYHIEKATELDPKTTQSINIKIPHKQYGYSNPFFNVMIVSDEKKTYHAETPYNRDFTKLNPICNIDLDSFEAFCLVGEALVCKDKNSVYYVSRYSTDYWSDGRRENMNRIFDLKMNPSTIKLILLTAENGYQKRAAFNDGSKTVIVNNFDNGSSGLTDIDADPKSIHTVFAKLESKSAYFQNPEDPEPDVDISDYSYHFLDSTHLFNMNGQKIKKITENSGYQNIENLSLFLNDWEKQRLESLNQVTIDSNK